MRFARCLPPSMLAWSLGTILLAQPAPPPLPKPKPIPRPKPIAGVPPGQAQPPAENPAAHAAPSRPAAEPNSPLASPKNAAPREPGYGMTPVPWPRGSTDPTHFPGQIPRFPGARRPAFSMSALCATHVFSCEEGPDAVARFYLECLEREHWSIVPIPGPPLERDRIVIGRRGDWTLRVDASPNPLIRQTEVFVMASLKPLPPPKTQAPDREATK